MAKITLNYDSVVKLKDALANVYWFKKDMVNLVNTFTSEWIGYDRTNKYSKKELATQVVDRLWREEKYEDLGQLISQILNGTDFSHFDGIENGHIYKERAIKYIDSLRGTIKA